MHFLTNYNVIQPLVEPSHLRIMYNSPTSHMLWCQIGNGTESHYNIVCLRAYLCECECGKILILGLRFKQVFYFVVITYNTTKDFICYLLTYYSDSFLYTLPDIDNKPLNALVYLLVTCCDVILEMVPVVLI